MQALPSPPAAAHFTPPTIAPPAKPMGMVQAIMTMADNPLKVWDEALFDLPYRSLRWRGHSFVQMVDPALIQAVFLDQGEAFAKSPMQLKVLRPGVGDGLLTVEGAVWRRQRRAASPAFRADAIDALAPMMAQAGARAADRLIGTGQGIVDVAPAMTQATLEIIAHAVLAPDNPALDLEKTARSVTAYVETMGRIDAGDVFGVPLWARLDKRRAFGAIRGMRETADQAIAWRRANGGDGRDLLNLLLQAKDPETGEAFSAEELRDNVLTFIAAGHETTALALTWALYCLAGSPQAQERLWAELDAVCPDHPVTARDVDRLAFHTAVLKEAMRLYPPVAALPRQANKDVDLGALKIEAGGLANALIYVMHRSRRLWDHPASFDPDRFIDQRAEGLHRFAWMPFGAGPRICIGLRFAMQEGVIVLAEIVRRLRFDLDGDRRPMPVLHITLRPEGGMPLRVSRR